VAPGHTLAGRYRIEDLVGETAGSRTWRAFDSVLNRSVGVQILAADDPRCTAFLEAARRSTVVTDPRFLRVLDVAEDEDGIAYTIREWARTVPLTVVLGEGPLPNRRAATLVTELAEAMAAAHEVGVQHRRLDLGTVHVKDTGAVRVSGLGTDHVLRSPERVPAQRSGEDTGETAVGSGSDSGTAAQYAAELSDVRAIGRILYACLVARWPGARDTGLPPAPTEHGRLLRPRQVRAGVSRDIDTVVDRILGTPPLHHLTPLVTARDVATELALVGEDDLLLDDAQSSLVDMVAVNGAGLGGATLDPPPALLPASRPRATPPAPPVEPPEAGASRQAVRSAIRTHRQLLGVGVALLVLLAASLAFVVGRESAQDDGSGGGRPTVGPTETPGQRTNAEVVTLEPESVTDFDPQGTDGGENAETAALAVDGDPDTAWTTLYDRGSPELGNLKDGVGLLIDLGRDREIWSYDALFTGSPTSFELYAAPPGTQQPPTTIAELGEPFVTDTADNDPLNPASRMALRPPVTARYVVLWLTSLPEETPGSGSYLGQVRELRLEGGDS
jgi:putative peptidoglycan lipid II flippase